MSCEKTTFNNLVLGDAVPVKQHELQLDAGQPVLALGQVEDKGLVEDGVEGPLLHVGLLLGNPLVVEQQVDLHVGIYTRGKFQFLQTRTWKLTRGEFFSYSILLTPQVYRPQVSKCYWSCSTPWTNKSTSDF